MLDLSSSRKKLKLVTFARMAELLAPLSTCKRAQCGAIIIAKDFSCVHSIGYNGPARGEAESNCTNETGKCGCVHAEANAVIKLRYVGSDKLVMISTTAPCYYCAGLIINCGVIDQVIWEVSYRNNEGTRRLQEAGIGCYERKALTLEYK